MNQQWKLEPDQKQSALYSNDMFVFTYLCVIVFFIETDIDMVYCEYDCT